LAAYNGNEEVVEFPLGLQDVNPDKADKWAIKPLSHVAQNGHERVVKVLLWPEGINLDELSRFDQTPRSKVLSMEMREC